MFEAATNISTKLDIIMNAVNDDKQQISNGAGELPNGYCKWLYFVGKITVCINKCYSGCNNTFLLKH